MIKTKQTKRKLEAEKERQEKYRIAKVPSRFGTVAKVATHDTPVYQVSQVLQGKKSRNKMHVPVVCLLMLKGSKVPVRNVIVLQ